MQDFLEINTFIGLSLLQWLTLIIVAISSYFFLSYLCSIAIKKLSVDASGTENRFNHALAEVLRSTQKITLALFALLIALQFLDLSGKWENRLSHLTFFVIGIQLALWVSKSITIWSNMQLLEKDEQAPNPVITSMLSWILKVAIWSIVLLAILSNVGINITAFIASLGVGGVAVALAVQNILSDLFASLAIGLDKPFVIGDFVVFGEVAGSIERIGLKTTHIRSISGEQIVCSNTELLKNTIHNYKRMSERRVEFKFGVTYDTPPAILAKIPGIVKSAIEKSEHTRFDRAHLKGFGSSSLDFEVIYFVDSSDFNLYMDIQQEINLDLIKEFNKLNISFALPTTNMHIRTLEAVAA